VKNHWTFSDGELLVSIVEEDELPDRQGNVKKSIVKDHGTWFDCGLDVFCSKLMKRFPNLMPSGGSATTTPATKAPAPEANGE
jgi:hypothetical protein